jgi:hypothetical protein
MDMDTVSLEVLNHSRLELPSSYDDFLNRLGARTRRNFRYYRRRFEATGGQYISGVPLDTFRSATRISAENLQSVQRWTESKERFRCYQLLAIPFSSACKPPMGNG